MSECISIITPCYNSEKTLERTIKSVIEQNYENYELILLDDGSNDSTCRIIDRYTSINNKIKGIFLDHVGVSRARNVGVEKASSNIITFLDSDDILYRNSLSSRLNTFKTYKDDESFVGVYCPAKKILLNNKSMGLSETFYKSDSGNAVSFGDTFKSPFVPSQVMLKKEKFLSVGGFKVDSGLCEDFLLWHELMRNHQYFILDEKVSIGYTQRSSSVVHTRPYEHFLEFDRVLKQVLLLDNDPHLLLRDIYSNEISRRAVYTLMLLVALNHTEDIGKLKNYVGKFELQYYTPEQLANMFKSACIRVVEGNLRNWDQIKKEKEPSVELIKEIILENAIQPTEFYQLFMQELSKNPVQLSRFNKAINKYKKLSSQNKLFLWILGVAYSAALVMISFMVAYGICK